MRLTKRDKTVINLLYQFRYMSFPQLERTYKLSKGTVYNRLAILRHYDYIEKNDNNIYFLGKKSLEIINGSISLNIFKKPKQLFIGHLLKINDFWMLLKNVCKTSEISLDKFLPEYHGGYFKGYPRNFLGDTVIGISHTPDAVFVLKFNGKKALFFLEIDNGTEGLSNLSKGVLKIINFYLHYLSCGTFVKYNQLFDYTFLNFHALFVTTNEKRITNIQKASDKVNFLGIQKEFIWLKTSEQVELDMFNNWVSLTGKTYEIR